MEERGNVGGYRRVDLLRYPEFWKEELVKFKMVKERSLSPVVKFLSGESTDTSGRHISDIHKYSYLKLEDAHDYIQWLFPTQRPSDNNDEAPVLSDMDIREIKKNEKLKDLPVVMFSTSN